VGWWLNVRVRTSLWSKDELKSADEVFVTGTAAEITAIGKIDDTNFTVGPVTRQLRDAYEALVRA